ncbi:class I SAM-dependent methyltransferase [Candidatus Amarobacter glycogenicus]|uniref:class I SAM-dependent methyltransferase n=1 Tax=Candidatus Amarobacter glycogenicus TaxID=3140699 RepID=UPI0031368FE2|nr:class I SAM-dependent methyltransferase [Dehalococcoidia bacterium]
MTAPATDRAMALQSLQAAAVGGLVTGLCIRLGGRLGLYEAMAQRGPMTAADVAAAAGLNERFVLEWLRQQASAGVLVYSEDGRFELDEPARGMLADTNSPSFVAGFWDNPQRFVDMFESAEGAFRTGIGRPFGEINDTPVREVAMRIPLQVWARNALVSQALPQLPGVIEKLRDGGAACDIGCGAGAAPLAIAAAFPRSRVAGYDTWSAVLELAEEFRNEAGLTNVAFYNPERTPLPETPEFDLVITSDMLHDLPRPDLMAASVRKLIRPGGSWFIIDPDPRPTFDEDRLQPQAANQYGFSLAICLQSGTATPDGWGLGLRGLPEPALRELVMNAGFSEFERVQGISHPFNAYYVARP